jgi:hypothetical protein
MKQLSLVLTLSLGVALPAFAAPQPAKSGDYSQECRSFADLKEDQRGEQREWVKACEQELSRLDQDARSPTDYSFLRWQPTR